MRVATRSSWASRSFSAASSACSRTSCGDADRRRGLGGQGRQQAPIVGRVVLLGQARPEVERADQLALRDQRHDEGDAGLAQGVDGG